LFGSLIAVPVRYKLLDGLWLLTYFLWGEVEEGGKRLAIG
jgi:hypothetical protein